MFDNVDRNRYYGIRVGDIVKEVHGDHVVVEGEVIEYGFMDNNRVIVQDKKTGDNKACVAEWCTIIQRVDAWVQSPKHHDAIITKDSNGYDGHYSKESYEYYGGYLIAESIPSQFINLISEVPVLVNALQKLLIHASDFMYKKHPDYLAAIAAIEKATINTQNNKDVTAE